MRTGVGGPFLFMKLQGIFPALTTSFDYEGHLYQAKITHNIHKLNEINLSGYVVCGSTGEAPLLGMDERIQLMRWVREASAEGKILIAGVGCESVHETVRLSDRAAEAGYHVALVLTPHYYRGQMHRPEAQALFFRAVADRSKLPVMLYNLPQATGYSLSPETVADLSHHPNIIGIKDSSGNLDNLRAIVNAAKPGFQVLSGSGINFCEAMNSGATGAILAIANPLPYACLTIWEALRMRQIEAAEDWQQRIFGAAKTIAEKHGIPGLKHAMDLNGYYGGPPRLPFIPPSNAAKREIEAAFDGLKS